MGRRKASGCQRPRMKHPRYEPAARVLGSGEGVAFVSHEGLVAIDRDAAAGKSYLVRKVTLERTELPSSSFSLHIDEDGVGLW